MGLLARLLESSSALEIVGQTFNLVDLSEDEVREFIADLSSEYVGLLLLVDVARQAKRLSRRKGTIPRELVDRSPDDRGEPGHGSPDSGLHEPAGHGHVLRTLSTDPVVSVRRNVADNQNAPREVLTGLSGDQDARFAMPRCGPSHVLDQP